MRKKATTRDVILIVALIGFGMVVASLMALRVMRLVNDQFQAHESISDEAKQTMTTVNTRLPAWVDSAFLLAWVLFMIVGLVLAFQVPTSPVFLPLSIFYFLFMVFISRLFASVYTQLASSSVLSTEAGLLTIIPYVVPRLHIFTFIFGILVVTLMVIKK